MTANPQKNPIFKIERTFDAPRSLLWKAWTDEKMFSQWFGPKGTKSEAKVFDVRKGGMIHTCMQQPNGEIWGKLVFREVAPQQKLVWEHAFSDKDGGITRHPMSPSWPLLLLTTVLFEDAGAKSKIILTWEPLNATDEEIKTFAEALPGMNQGWGGSFEQLDSYLAETKAA